MSPKFYGSQFCIAPNNAYVVPHSSVCHAYTVSHTKPDSNGGHPATRLSDDERERAIKAVFHAIEMKGAYIN